MTSIRKIRKRSKANPALWLDKRAKHALTELRRLIKSLGLYKNPLQS